MKPACGDLGQLGGPLYDQVGFCIAEDMVSLFRTEFGIQRYATNPAAACALRAIAVSMDG